MKDDIIIQLRDIISCKYAIIDVHYEEEGDKFSLTGTFIDNQIKKNSPDCYRFNFYNENKILVLRLLEV
jgi:hypothetical protein